MDAQLAAVAAHNGGYFSRAEALDLGWTDRALASARRTGVLRRIRQGAYAFAETYDVLDAVGQHLVLARAAVARQRGDVALTGVSAAAVHGLVLHDFDLSAVHLVRLDGGSARNENGVRHHVVADDVARHVEERHGLLVTNPGRTVWELAGQASLEAGVAMADSALRLIPDLEPVLRAMANTFDARPRSRRARVVIGLSDGRSGSAGESYSRVVFFRHGVPMPELQHLVVDVDGVIVATTDFYWELDRHVGEFDGKIKYGELLRVGETATDAVFREKRREDAIRSQVLGMSRWTWRDVLPAHAREFVRRLNFERARSRRLYAHNRTIVV